MIDDIERRSEAEVDDRLRAMLADGGAGREGEALLAAARERLVELAREDGCPPRMVLGRRLDGEVGWSVFCRDPRTDGAGLVRAHLALRAEDPWEDE